MATEFEKRYKERQIIKKESALTIKISIGALLSVIVYALISYFVKIEPIIEGTDTLDDIHMASGLVTVMILVFIFGIKRSIYYSPRIIHEDFTLTRVLQKWRTIDIVLISIAEIIPLYGMVITLLGMPFDKNIYLFVGSFALMFILMPMGLKVRSKLSILKQAFPDIPIE
ncbi:MAG: hypothetical protein GY765_03760 [bacterium]|nr:hypothetical protein [bacterium]